MNYKLILMFGLILLALPLVSANLEDDLISYYKLDEISGTNAKDAHGSNDGTANDSRVFTSEIAGIINTGADFTQGNDDIDIGTGFGFSGAFTLSAWVNRSVISSDQTIIGKWAGGGNNKWLFVINTDNNAQLYIGGGTTLTANTSLTSTSEWYHIVAVHNGTHSEIFVNGISDGSTTSNSPSTGTQTVYIGRMEDLGWYFDGVIDEVGLWERALNTTEVTELYNSGNALEYPFSPEPTIELISPANDTVTTSRDVEFTANFTVENVNWTRLNATLYIWDAADDSLIANQTILSPNESMTFNMTDLPIRQKYWNVLGWYEDPDSNINFTWAGNNFTILIREFEINSEVFEADVFETAQTTFSAQISTIEEAEVFSASLNYSGEAYPATVTNLGGGSFNLTRTIDVPAVDSNTTNEFNWIISLDLGDVFSIQPSETNTQNVTKTDIMHVTSGNSALNFTTKDEDTLDSVDSKMQIQFEWWLGSGTEKQSKGITIDERNSFAFQLNQTNISFNVDMQVALNNVTGGNGTDYDARVYDFQNFVLNTENPIERDLFLLKEDRGREFIIEVKDSGLAPLQDYRVELYRFYPGANTHRLVESRITDVFGQTTFKVIENVERYRILFYDDEGNLIKTTNRAIFTCRQSICISQFIIEDLTEFFTDFDPLADYEFTFQFNNQTNVFTFVWNDNRADSPLHRLNVRRTTLNGTVTVCDVSSNDKIGILTCDVGDSRATYSAQVFRTVAGNERRVALMDDVRVGDTSQRFGLEGLIWSFILLFTMILIGIFYPPIGIGLYIVGVFLLGMLDVIYINPAIMVAKIAIGVLFIWAFRG